MPEKPLDGEDERYGGVDEDDSGEDQYDEEDEEDEERIVGDVIYRLCEILGDDFLIYVLNLAGEDELSWPSCTPASYKSRQISSM